MIIVLDPGHGGTATVGGSSPNNAVSFSGVLEKTMTLDMAKRIRRAFQGQAPEVEVVLTRLTDVNVGINARAQVAANHHADLFLSLHFNATIGARGVETWVRGVRRGNVNLTADRAFAQKVQKAVVQAIRSHDANTPDRGVKSDDDRPEGLGVLNDVSLGNTGGASHLCRACLAEIEFIDHPAVDRLFNTGANVETVRNDVAAAIAGALLAELGVAFSAAALLGAGASALTLVPDDGPAPGFVGGQDFLPPGVLPPPSFPVGGTAHLRSSLFRSDADLEEVAQGNRLLRAGAIPLPGIGKVQDAFNRLAAAPGGGDYHIDFGPTGGGHGRFGQRTERAARNFQRDLRLGVDGTVGQETIAALDEALVRLEEGRRPVPPADPQSAAPAPGSYAPPPASAAPLTGVDFARADANRGRRLFNAYATADLDPRLAKGDPSRCPALLQFPDGTVFSRRRWPSAPTARRAPNALIPPPARPPPRSRSPG